MEVSLETTARALLAPGKGLLAADESTPTIEKRLQGIGLESNEKRRRAYRELLFTTAGAAEFISGVILFDETIRQSAADGTPFVQVLERQGIIPGIKVDKGARPLAHFPGETVTEGLDDLRNRLAEYRSIGARFAKWRATITIGRGLPTATCLDANGHALARYAALCQEEGLVPIVEPEVLMDGDHTLEQSAEATHRMLLCLYEQLDRHRVTLGGTLLKPNMVESGTTCSRRAGLGEVADATLEALRAVVPATVPGIAFLSGGQRDKEATAHLDAINRRGAQPWALTFSYGRALQGPVLDAWKGEQANVAAAQAVFLHRARMNSAARAGAYHPSMEQEEP